MSLCSRKATILSPGELSHAPLRSRSWGPGTPEDPLGLESSTIQAWQALLSKCGTLGCSFALLGFSVLKFLGARWLQVPTVSRALGGEEPEAEGGRVSRPQAVMCLPCPLLKFISLRDSGETCLACSKP